MKAGICYNKNRLSENKSFIEQLKIKLNNQEIECTVVSCMDDLDGLDVLFVLGGDGTILTVAAACAKRKIRILGINCGRLGFLAQFEREKVDDAIELACNGKFAVDKRTMLEIECGGKKYLALNDLVLQRSTGGSGFSNTVEIRAEIDGSIVDNYLSDGIIVSTPTGSTAYSLSAGGSVLTPEINAFIMTPICAHSLHSRPVVYNDNSILKLIPLGKETPLNLIVDGKVVDVINNKSIINVRKSEFFVEFVSRGDKDFFNKLLFKLNIWSK